MYWSVDRHHFMQSEDRLDFALQPARNTEGLEQWSRHLNGEVELRGKQSWVEEYRLQGGYLRSGRLQHRWAALEPADDELPAGAVFLQDLECPLFEESETGRKRRLLVKTSRSLEPGNHADMPWVGMITALR